MSYNYPARISKKISYPVKLFDPVVGLVAPVSEGAGLVGLQILTQFSCVERAIPYTLWIEMFTSFDPCCCGRRGSAYDYADCSSYTEIF